MQGQGVIVPLSALFTLLSQMPTQGQMHRDTGGILSAHQPSQEFLLFLGASSVHACSHALIHSADACG